MLEKLTKWVGKYPKTVIAVVIVLTVFFYFGLTKINMVTETKEMLPEGDPVVAAFDEVGETFGGAEYAMILLNMGEVFTIHSLHEINQLTKDLEKIKGVNSVMSITNVEEIRGVEGGIEVADLIEEIPTGESELQKLKQRVLSDDDYAGQIVSKNGEIALVLIQLLPNVDKERLISDVREVVQKLGLDEKAYLTGEPVMGSEMGKGGGQRYGEIASHNYSFDDCYTFLKLPQYQRNCATLTYSYCYSYLDCWLDGMGWRIFFCYRYYHANYTDQHGNSRRHPYSRSEP